MASLLAGTTACQIQPPAAGTPVAVAIPTVASSATLESSTTPASAGPSASLPPGAVAGPPAAPSGKGWVARRVKVLQSYPHSPDAFTQGLFLHDGVFYESTGLYGQSTLRTVDPKTGQVLRRQMVPSESFAEGLALVGDRLIQLTWQEHLARVYDAESWAKVGEFRYDTEGWGLCYDQARNQLAMSDGSARLVWRDPAAFTITGGVTVTLDGQPVTQLNELECVGDEIYANIWQTNTIVGIGREDGQVNTVIDASGLLTAEEQVGADVLNGIAYDSASGHFFITGKLWPKMFEVEFVPSSG